MTHADRTARSNRERQEAYAARLAEFRRLRRARYTLQQAAWRIGVSAATARRYERTLGIQAAGMELAA
jgi:hypothetical protein